MTSGQPPAGTIRAPTDLMQAPAGERGGEPPRLAGQLVRAALDIGAPIAVYYLLHAAGVSNLVALCAGAVPPALSGAWTLAVRRRADPIVLLVLTTLAASVCASVIAHSPRFLLAKEGLITGVWAAWFLASTGTRSPAAFTLARPFMEGRRVFAAGSWDQLWQNSAPFRRIWRTSTVIWGMALLADAVLRAIMAYTLPVSVVPGLGGALWPVTFVLIQVVTNVYYHRAGLYRILGARWLGSRR
jgi:hypothetical protein